jgi:hypothetical protein
MVCRGCPRISPPILRQAQEERENSYQFKQRIYLRPYFYFYRLLFAARLKNLERINFYCQINAVMMTLLDVKRIQIILKNTKE